MHSSRTEQFASHTNMTDVLPLLNVQNSDSMYADPYFREHFTPKPAVAESFPNSWRDADELRGDLRAMDLDALNHPAGADASPSAGPTWEERTFIPIGSEYMRGADAVMEQLQKYAKIERHTEKDVKGATGICVEPVSVPIMIALPPEPVISAPPPPTDDWHLKMQPVAEPEPEPEPEPEAAPEPEPEPAPWVELDQCEELEPEPELEPEVSDKKAVKKAKKAAKKAKKKAKKAAKKKAKKAAAQKAQDEAKAIAEAPAGQWRSVKEKKLLEHAAELSEDEAPAIAMVPDDIVDDDIVDDDNEEEEEDEEEDDIDSGDSLIVEDSASDDIEESDSDAPPVAAAVAESSDDEDDDRPPKRAAPTKKRRLPARAKRGKAEKLFIEEDFHEDLVEDPNTGKLVKPSKLAASKKRAAPVKAAPSRFSQLAPGSLMLPATKRVVGSGAPSSAPKRSRVYETKPLSLENLYNPASLDIHNLRSSRAFEGLQQCWHAAVFVEAHAAYGEAMPTKDVPANDEEFLRFVRAQVRPQMEADLDPETSTGIDRTLLLLQRAAWAYAEIDIVQREDGKYETRLTRAHDPTFPPFAGKDVVLYSEPGQEIPYLVAWQAMHPQDICVDEARHVVRETRRLKGGVCRNARSLYETICRNPRWMDTVYLRWANACALAEYKIFKK